MISSYRERINLSRRTKHSVILFIIILAILLCCAQLFADKADNLTIHFIDVGQGDSILLHSSNGTTILIDGGTPDNGNNILLYLKRLGIEKLDLVISTHPHADHIGGLSTVLEGIQVNGVVDPGVIYPTGTYESYLRTIKEKKIPFKTVVAGDKIEVSDINLILEVLAPFPEQLDYDDDVNDVSIVIRAIFGKVRFLLTGDAGFNTEDLLIRDKVYLESTVLKVGHHGSRYSTGDLFLRLVKPEVAVIQVGDNSYGHPTEDVLEKLARRNVKIFRNDHHGTIVITTDGEKYEVKTEKILMIAEDKRVNINKAPEGDILDIPGVDIDLAREIVKYREYFGIFLNAKELLQLKSITPERLEEILPYIKFVD